MHKSNVFKKDPLLFILLGGIIFSLSFPPRCQSKEVEAAAVDKERAGAILEQALLLEKELVSEEQRGYALSKLAEGFSTIGDLEKAELLASHISQSYLKAFALMKLAEAYFGQGNKDDAIRLLQEAEAINQQFAQTYFLSAIFLDEEDSPLALEFLGFISPLLDRQLQEGRLVRELAVPALLEKRLVLKAKQGNLDEALSEARKELASLSKAPEAPSEAILKARVFIEIFQECRKQKNNRLAKEALEEALAIIKSLRTDYQPQAAAGVRLQESFNLYAADTKIIILSQIASGFVSLGRKRQARQIIGEYLEKPVFSVFSPPSILAMAYAGLAYRQAGFFLEADKLDSDVYEAAKGFIQEVSKLSESAEDPALAQKQATLFAITLHPYLSVQSKAQLNRILAEAIFSQNTLFKENLFMLLASMCAALGQKETALNAALSTDTVYYRTRSLIDIAKAYAKTQPQVTRKILFSALKTVTMRSLFPLEKITLFSEIAIALDALPGAGER